jgi:hypothetical protein
MIQRLHCIVVVILLLGVILPCAAQDNAGPLQPVAVLSEATSLSQVTSRSS